MACPFCALGCRDGQPRTEEVTRNWRFLQLTAHPDPGGNTEAAAFLNTTKEYAIHYIKHLSTGKMGTISCRRHGNTSNEVPSPTYPIYQPHSTASASNDMFPPPPSTEKRAATPPKQPSCEDPWATEDRTYADTARVPTQQPPPAPATPPPPTESPPQQGASPAYGTHHNDTQLPPPPLSNNHIRGWYDQTFRCRLDRGGCGAEATYSGHGHRPFEIAQEEGWYRPKSGSWAGKAYCKACATKHYGPPSPLHHTSQGPVLLPSPTIASPQPTSPIPWH